MDDGTTARDVDERRERARHGVTNRTQRIASALVDATAMTNPESMMAEARARAMRIAASLETGTTTGATGATRGVRDDSEAQRPRARNDVADPRAIDLDDEKTREKTIEVGALPALARRANLGAMGGYHPVDAEETRRGTSTPPPPNAYLERRFDRFYRDVRGYDADARARTVLETACGTSNGRGATDGGATRRARGANVGAGAGASAARAGGSTRAGLGSRPDDDDDAYATFRSSRSAAFHRASAPAR